MIVKCDHFPNFRGEHKKCLKPPPSYTVTLPEPNIAPRNGWLEYYLPIGEAYFQVRLLLVSGRVATQLLMGHSQHQPGIRHDSHQPEDVWSHPSASLQRCVLDSDGGGLSQAKFGDSRDPQGHGTPLW